MVVSDVRAHLGVLVGFIALNRSVAVQFIVRAYEGAAAVLTCQAGDVARTFNSDFVQREAPTRLLLSATESFSARRLVANDKPM